MRNRVTSLAPAPLVCAALLISSICGCPGDDPADVDYLEIERYLPVLPIPVDSSLYVEFSHTFDLASAESRCRLEFRLTEVPVPCSVSVAAADARRLEIIPDEPLEYSTLYTLHIYEGVESPEVEPLIARGSWMIKTEDDPTPGPQLGIPPFDVYRHGYDLHAIWRSPRGFIHAGADGVALIGSPFHENHWLLSTETSQRVNGVWCSNTGVAWMAYGDGAGTGGGVIRYANRERTLMATTTHAVSGLFGVAADHVYATHGNEILEFSPTGQEIHTGPEAVLLDVWVIRDGTEDILWVAGSEGLYRGVRTGSGITWEKRIDTTYPLVAVSGNAVDVVVAVGGTTVHRLAPDHEMWAAPLYEWIDVSWHVDAPGPIVVGISPTGGGAGVVFHGSSPATREASSEPLYAVHADFPGTWPGVTVQGYAVGAAGTRVRVDPATDDWGTDPLPKRVSGEGIAAWTELSAAPDDLLGLRADTLLEWNIATDAYVPRDGPEDLTLTKLDYEAADSLYVAGLDAGGIDWYIAHYDGSDWTRHWMSSSDVPNDIWGAAPNDVFVVCDYGFAYRVGGILSLMTVTPAGEHLRGVWGVAADSVFAVGEGGLIAHFTTPASDPEGIWSVMDSGTTNDLHAISGTSAGHAVAVGDSRTVLRFNGNDWADLSPTSVPPIIDLTMVYARSEDEVWAASPDGMLLRFNGLTWQVWTVPLPGMQLRTMTYAYPQRPWFGGENDLLLRSMGLPPAFPLIEED